MRRCETSLLCCTDQQQYQRASYSLWYGSNTCSARPQLPLHSHVPVTLSSLIPFQSNPKIDFFLMPSYNRPLLGACVCIFFWFIILSVSAFHFTPLVCFMVELSCELHTPHRVNATALMCRSNSHLVCHLCSTQSSVT